MITTTTHLTDVAGVTLEERHTVVSVSLGPAGLGITYRRPTHIRHGSGETAIPDVMFWLRLGALALAVLLATTRRYRS